MAKSEARTLSITAKLIDLMTRPLGTMQGSFLKFAKGIVDRTKSLLASVFNLKTAVLGLAASFLSLSTVKAFGEQADALLKLSSSTGDTVENLSELQAAFDLAGVKAENFDVVLRALLTQARKAQTDGTDKLRDSFADLGVSLEDLQRLGPAQLFEKLAAGLEQFGTAQERAVALGKILPKQFLDLLPILGGGLQKFQAAIVEAREAGATVTQNQARISERLNDSLSKIQISIGGVSRALIESFGPDAIAIFERLAKEITNNREGILKVAEAVGTTLVRAFGLAVDAVIGFIGVIEDIPGVSLIEPPEELQKKLDRSQQAIDRARQRRNAGRGTPDEARLESEFRATLARQAELYAQVENFTLANQLKKTRAALANELAGVAGSIGGNPVVGAAAATAVGLPTPEAVAALGPGLVSGLNEAIAATAAARATANQAVASVFDSPTGGALGFADLADDVAAARDQVDKLNDELDKTKTLAFGGDFFEGFNKGAKEGFAAWTNFGQAGEDAAQQIIVGGLDGLTDTLGQTIARVDGSSQAWRRLGQTALAELTRIIAKLVVVNALSAAFGYQAGGVQLEKGGVVDGDMGAPRRAFARGGVATGPTLALFGEGNKREAFVPLPDNRRIPVMLMGDGGGGGPTINFNITAMDGRDVQRVLVDHAQTIGSIVRQQMDTRVGMRQSVQRSAR